MEGKGRGKRSLKRCSRPLAFRVTDISLGFNKFQYSLRQRLKVATQAFFLQEYNAPDVYC